MVGKKSGRALLRDEGLQRTDNGMDFSSWPQVNMINQKNYYTDFLKRDDQILALRLQHDEQLNRRKKAAVDIDRARAQAAQDDVPFAEPEADLDEDVGMDGMDGENYGSKTIVIHVGSQNMRIGFATDALPKTIPMVIARKSKENEAEIHEPRPKRRKLDEDAPSEEWFGEEFSKEYAAMAAEFRTFRRSNKRRVLPNSRELVTKWNSTNPPEEISEHNDPLRIEWTELPPNPANAPGHFIGNDALRIPDESKPRYHLSWPIRHGWLNEADYATRTMLERDFFVILEHAIRVELNLSHKKDWSQCSCVFIIPDIYEKVFVTRVLDEFMLGFSFQRVSFMQESLAATFGAGIGSACIVDIGAQKTSVCCVEDGMCIEDSRINLKYGGYDVTETFVKMMLNDRFNYADFNLMKRHDFLLAEELKEQHCSMADDNISVQLYEFHLRVQGQSTLKYSFKMYDEGFLAPMGFFRPAIFDHSEKLRGRRKLIPRAVDLYSGHPNDPLPQAQMAVVQYVEKNIPTAVLPAPLKPTTARPTPLPGRNGRPSGLPLHLNGERDDTPRSSVANSPAPDDKKSGLGAEIPNAGHEPGQTTASHLGGGEGDLIGAQTDIELIDATVPLMPLDEAILTSINFACGGSSGSSGNNNSANEIRRRDLLGSVMLIGGGCKTPQLGVFLEARLRALMPQYPKEILVVAPPREMDPAVLVWKGGSVFGKLRMTNDSWVGQVEYDRLGARILNYKCMWHW